MKKKILTSVIITVLFALVIITSSFFALVSMQEVDNTRNILINYNSIMANWKEMSKESVDLLRINGNIIDVTVTNKDGKVIFDNTQEGKTVDLNCKEYTSIGKDNIGYFEGYSLYYKKDMIFSTLRLGDGTIIRSGVPVGTLDVLYSKNISYYLGVLAVVFILSIALALKLVRIIIDPVKNLEYVSSKIANGDLQTRIEITSNDELGYLGMSFNNMADQLQSKINEVMDKQNKLESILKSMQSGVIAVDKEDSIILLNPYAKKILGINKEVVGLKLKDVMYKKLYNEILLEEYDTAKEIKVKSPVRRILRVKKTWIINGYEKIGIVISIQDVTEMKRLENMRTQFVANVSHELKTPLTSIKGFAETLRFVEDTETRDKFLDIIDKESERLRRLIDDILVLSNLESRSSEDLIEFYPEEVIEDALNILEDHAKRKNIKLIYHSNNNDKILGHNDKFLQLVINLVENAIKYSENDKEVLIESSSDDEYYTFRVKDNGYGIPKEDLPRIFERFYRVDKSRKGGGTGLGLAIAKHISKSFGGDIKVESEFGKGSEFTFKVKHL
ncbi:HAMP domain-containing sensor histidine kinase [Clostridium thermobutyricum]|uniref:histidine kinase n=1 Tax=Clostridium thermobutyricum DSM 4928 TaxID=1121339 RepID=A0A1V4SZL2_9CLOT|nr:sensor histidine kinase [Clostridium thermobutyricum]OPX51301.1 sensor protein kinase WalK [Clostridium thermobutyricum DSM 4928]